jgi:hypothetical protein
MGLIISKGIGTVTRIVTPFVPAKEAVYNEENELVSEAVAEVAEVTEQVDAEIIIKGTTIKLDSVYCRIGFEAPANGVKLPCVNWFYTDKEAFESNPQNRLEVNLETSPVAFDVVLQSVEVAHEKMKEFFENLGYGVEIIL